MNCVWSHGKTRLAPSLNLRDLCSTAFAMQHWGLLSRSFFLDSLALVVIGFVHWYEDFPGLFIKKLQPRSFWSAVVFSRSTLGIVLTLYRMSTFPAFVHSEWKNGTLELCVEHIWGRQKTHQNTVLTMFWGLCWQCLMAFMLCTGVLLRLLRFLFKGTFQFLISFQKKICPELLFKGLKQCLCPDDYFIINFGQVFVTIFVCFILTGIFSCQHSTLHWG